MPAHDTPRSHRDQHRQRNGLDELRQTRLDLLHQQPAKRQLKKSVLLVREHRHHGRRSVHAREDECDGCLETGRRI